MKKINTVWWDWSGVLSDDRLPVYEATMLVFDKLGHPRITYPEFLNQVVLPFMAFWWKFFPSLSKKEADKLFREAFHDAGQPVIYDGAKDVLERFYNDGVNLMVLSSRGKNSLRAEAQRYGILDYFTKIVAGVHYKWKGMGELMNHNGFNPQRTVFVGDMTHDIDTGRAAGVITVASLYGYHGREKLEAFQPHYYISDIRELPRILSAP